MTLLERLLLVAVVAALTTKVPIKRHKICVTRRRMTRKGTAGQGRGRGLAGSPCDGRSGHLSGRTLNGFQGASVGAGTDPP